MFLNKKIILLCLSIHFIIGCENEHFSFLSKKERLISNIWEINTFIDHSTNTSFEIPYSTYEFKEDGTFITNRYEGVRIGTNIYITTGKVEESVVRTMDDPRSCTLSINGMFYSDRNGDPFSLVVSTANLQD